MNDVIRTSNPLYSPTKAAREWAQRRGRADDAMLIEAWTTGWNARCIPEEPGALADHLRSMLLDGTVQCPLCGKTGPHPHSPEEVVIYRNGVKYGRSLKSASDETGDGLETVRNTIRCRDAYVSDDVVLINIAEALGVTLPARTAQKALEQREVTK